MEHYEIVQHLAIAPLIVGGALAGLGSIGSAIFGSNAQDKANQQNLQIYEDQKKYNAPIEQMRRLREAGLNPNLVYGNGSVVGNTSSQAPTVAPVNKGAALGEIGSSLQGIMGLMAQQAQTNNILADTMNKGASTALTNARTTGQGISNEIAENTKYLKEDMVTQAWRMNNADYDRKIQDINFRNEINPQLITEQVNKTLASAYAPGMSKAQLNLELGKIDFQTITNELAKKGIMPNSPWYVKGLVKIISKLIPNFSIKDFF